MLRPTFKLRADHSIVIYARMSDPNQNPRSPDQQITVIKEMIKRMRLPWRVVKIYRDDGKSARYQYKRPQFKAMLSDLKAGRLQIQVIALDTFERLSRAEDAADIRRKLRKLGVEVVTANSNFTDPTTPGGETLAMMEAYRAKVDGEVKGHNVNRGKRDACRLGHWPGGPPNFGYRLKAILVNDVSSHNVLAPDPHTAWIIVEVYRFADERGWGCLRIVKALNADPRIPDGLKPFHADTIGEWLDNPIYHGTLIWSENCTGPENDRRVTQPIPEDEWEVIENFCPPLVDRAVAERVRQMREARRQAWKASHKPGSVSLPRRRGIALRYLLSGLVRCQHCGHSMTAAGCGAYTPKNGKAQRYVKYVCPGFLSGTCPNHRRIPEAWLREAVLQIIAQRLFFKAH